MDVSESTTRIPHHHTCSENRRQPAPMFTVFDFSRVGRNGWPALLAYWPIPDFAQVVYLTLQAVLGLETL
jgi:hypothetical protein